MPVSRMAAFADAEGTLCSTNDEAGMRKEFAASKQTTEGQVDEIKELREDYIRLKTEFGVCKRFTEGLLEDLRKLADELTRELEDSKQATKCHLEELKQLRASAEETKDELTRELEDSKQATIRHLEELKQLRASAGKDKDKLKRELEDSKQATQGYLENQEELRVEREAHSKHKENMDPSGQPLYKKLKGFFGATKPKKKKKHKNYPSDEITKRQSDEPKADCQAEGNSDSLMNADDRSSLERDSGKISRHPSFALSENEHDKSPGKEPESPYITFKASAQFASPGPGSYIDPDRYSSRVSQSSFAATYSEDRHSLLDRYKAVAPVSRHHSFGVIDRRPPLLVHTPFHRGSRTSLAYGRNYYFEGQDLDDPFLDNPLPGRSRRVHSFESLPLGHDLPLGLSNIPASPQPCQITIVEQPKSKEEKEGSRVEFEFKVQGANRLSYQWFKDGVELLGKNKASLVLECIQLRDFGCYVCRVSTQHGFGETMAVLLSGPAALDVIPQCLNGMRPKRLQELDLNTREEISSLLENRTRTSTLGGWKQVAVKYGMQENKIRVLENSREPGKDVIEFLNGSKPDLTVYSFCKVLKADKIERFDIVKLLEDHLLIRDSESRV